MRDLRDLAVAGVFGVLVFFAVFVIGSGVVLATGIPTSGGLVNMTISIFLVICGAKIIDKFGATTIIMTVTGILSIPTMTFGAPGLHKVPMLFLTGLTMDIIISLAKRKDPGYIVAGTLTGFLGPLYIYAILILVGLPGADMLKPMIIPFMLIYAVLAFIGAYLGIKIYEKRFRNLSVVQNLKQRNE